jgi:DNA-binding transcriptional ArsR family regulator
MSRNDATVDLCDERIVHQDQVAKAAKSMLAEHTLDDLADIFKILSHQTRLKILHALSAHELCVCDLAALLSMTESAVSHQLRSLRNMRLVRSRREGKLVYYALDDHHVQQLFAAALDHIQEK